MEIIGLLGRKICMTTHYSQNGDAQGVTIVKVGPCVITQVKTDLKDGYEAIQIGFVSTKRVNKPLRGHMARAGDNFRHLEEFGVRDLSELEVGQELRCTVFKEGDKVKVVGISKGRGFAGGVKRHGFHGGPKTHGQSDRHRAPGSIGASASPSRVLPGTKMAGHYGAARVTVRGLEVLMLDEERDILLIKGGVPGPPNGLLRIEKQTAGQ